MEASSTTTMLPPRKDTVHTTLLRQPMELPRHRLHMATKATLLRSSNHTTINLNTNNILHSILRKILHNILNSRILTAPRHNMDPTLLSPMPTTAQTIRPILLKVKVNHNTGKVQMAQSVQMAREASVRH